MLLLHGEALLLKYLLELIAGVVLVGLVLYFAWRSVDGWGKRN